MDKCVIRPFLASILMLLAGCVSISPFDAANLSRVRSGEEAIVMMRFSVTDQDGAQITPFAFWLPEVNIELELGDFDSGGMANQQIRVSQFPTAAARDEGFIYLILKPGFYYLTIKGGANADAMSNARGLPTITRWRIELPQGIPVLYAGSMILSGKSYRLPQDEIVITSVDQAATRVIDETDRARSAVARDLPDFGAPVSRPVIRHTGPILLGIPSR
jgi:hypothetical protein